MILTLVINIDTEIASETQRFLKVYLCYIRNRYRKATSEDAVTGPKPVQRD